MSEPTTGGIMAQYIKALNLIAELKVESAQWQESCGRNFVRATEAEMREEKKDERISNLEAAIEKHRDAFPDEALEGEKELWKALEKDCGEA